MTKRRFRFSVEFVEDLINYTKMSEFYELRKRVGKPLIRVTVDHEDGYVQTVPIELKFDPTDLTYTAEWDVPALEDLFEREVFRTYRD